MWPVISCSRQAGTRRGRYRPVESRQPIGARDPGRRTESILLDARERRWSCSSAELWADNPKDDEPSVWDYTFEQ